MSRHIVWPENKPDAIRLYLAYALRVLSESNSTLDFQLNNPVDIAKRYVNGTASLEDLSHAADAWWEYIYQEKALSNFSDRNILLARLALCLLSIEAIDDFNEAASWFVQVLQKLGIETNNAIRLIDECFTFSEK
jgi:hypothetical protein